MNFFNKCFDHQKFYIRINEIDFEGQLLAKRINQLIFFIFTIIAMIVSYTTQHLCYGMYILLSGFFLCLLVCLPAWPMYNKHNLQWLKYAPQDQTKEDYYKIVNIY